MRPATLTEVARAIGADLPTAHADALVARAAIDSRKVRKGDLFFAMRGRTDGADFAPEAHLRGAVATVATRPLDVPTLVVEDSEKALQRLARWTLVRPDAPSPTVVDITGTVGKTTTKDALATILRHSGKRISATEGNLNNELGLPLTVLSADPRTEVLVLEMGATHAGDIETLCGIAPPEIGILTAISPVHLDSFGSLEGLAAAKGELALALPETGTLVAPVNAPERATGSGRNLGRRITFAREGDADLVASGIEGREEGLRFVATIDRESAEIRSPVFGTHLVEPLLAALGGALALGLDLEVAAGGLSRLRRTGLRGDVYRLKDDIVVYDDSYNASPAAVAAVLEYGAEQATQQGRRLVVVLGGMFELGPCAREYHREAGKLADEVGVDLLVCVGDEARWYAEAFGGKTLFYEDAATAAESLRDELRGGDYLIVKGSRGVELDTLTRKLRESLALV
ncbi:MAG TPA: UDP-N-acetylmuramoyl-tripeptide--D-alanyl-D-alanine ligase [Rubrobacter sp.]